MQMGAGLGMGQVMGNLMTNQQQQQPAQQPQQQQPAQQTSDDPMQKLEKLKKMFEAGFINEKEYTDKKQEILSNF